MKRYLLLLFIALFLGAGLVLGEENEDLSKEQKKKGFISTTGKELAKKITDATADVTSDASTDAGKVFFLSEIVREATSTLNGNYSDELNFAIADKLKKDTEEKAFLSNFGVALAFPVNREKRPFEVVTEEADASNDRIKAIKYRHQYPRYMVEVHKGHDFYHGFTLNGFLALGLASAQDIPISSVAIGGMVGFQSTDKKKWFNVGGGQMYDYTKSYLKKQYEQEGTEFKRGTNIYETGLWEIVYVVSFNAGW